MIGPDIMCIIVILTILCYIRIKYVTQLKTAFPAFAFFCNYPEDIKVSYKRFLENKLREQYDFEGVPIQIYFRSK